MTTTRPDGLPLGGSRPVVRRKLVRRSDDSARWTRLNRAVALVLVAVAPVGLELASGFSVGLVLALAMTPVWIGHVRRWWGGPLLLTLIVLALGSGAWLTAVASADHAVTVQGMRTWVGLMLGLAATVGVILWARSLHTDGTVAVAYGVGMLLWSARSAAEQSNAWKSSFSLPLTLILLGLAWSSGRRGLSIVLALGLGVTSALNDSRSHFAMVLLAAGAVAWQMWFRGRGRRRTAVGSILLAGVLGLAVLNLAQAMMLEGYLGDDTQARTEGQIERSGSILLGGRPEIGATVALMAHRPMGLGYGTLPGPTELQVAKTGMATLNYDPDNGYVHNYMFGGILKLHSLIGDMWSMFGLVGVALAITVGVLVVHRLGRDFADGALTALMAYLCSKIIWELFFGPLFSAMAVLGLTLGLALLPRRSGARQAAHRDLSARTGPGTTAPG